MLYTASRACLQHPDVAAYKANRDLIYKQLQHAVSGISNAAQATATEDSALSQPGGGGELAYALNNFDVSQMRVLQVTPHLPFFHVSCHTSWYLPDQYKKKRSDFFFFFTGRLCSESMMKIIYLFNRDG